MPSTEATNMTETSIQVGHLRFWLTIPGTTSLVGAMTGPDSGGTTRPAHLTTSGVGH